MENTQFDPVQYEILMCWIKLMSTHSHMKEYECARLLFQEAQAHEISKFLCGLGWQVCAYQTTNSQGEIQHGLEVHDPHMQLTAWKLSQP